MSDKITFDLKVYADGKTTIPQTVRDRLELNKGDILVVTSGKVYGLTHK